MEYFLLYVWLKLDALQIFLSLLALGSIGAALVFAIMGADDYGDNRQHFYKKSVKSLITCIVLAGSAFMLPSSKDIAYIVGGKLAMDVARSDVVGEMASDTLQIMRNYLKEQLKDKK